MERVGCSAFVAIAVPIAVPIAVCPSMNDGGCSCYWNPATCAMNNSDCSGVGDTSGVILARLQAVKWLLVAGVAKTPAPTGATAAAVNRGC